MSRLIILLVYSLAACSAWSPSRASGRLEQRPRVADSVSAPHAIVDLTGSWATGSGGEPTARSIVAHPPCNYSPDFLLIEQHADSVRAWVVPESHAQGVRSPDPAPRIAATGRLVGVDVTLESAGAQYVLRYDSTSGHLRGTLNGAPFWAAREEIIRPEGCIPPP
jgi:hypothetical protein